MAISQPELAMLDESIEHKMAETQEWVVEKYGDGYAALFLMDADAWQHFPKPVQTLGGWAMAHVLAETYPPGGKGYPLPEYIGKDHNAASIASGSMRPYFGFAAPRGLTAEMVYANPELLLEQQRALRLFPIAVSARMVGADGSEELGRSARLPGAWGRRFRGGALILQSYVDWHAQPAEASHVVRAEVRVADEHMSENNRLIASSAATQKLHFGELGMCAVYFGYCYNVGNRLEPFAIGELYRTDTWREHLRDFKVYSPDGPHLTFLDALCRHQTGESLPLVVTAGSESEQYMHCAAPQVHGKTVYAKVAVVEDAKGADTQDLLQTVTELDDAAPLVMVKVPAHTPRGAATQSALLHRGYTVCGLEPPHDVPASNDQPAHVVPPMVYMARLGAFVRSGDVPLARALFLPELYGPALQREFARIDHEFVSTVAQAGKHA